jgi:hypothetical protein
MKSVRQNVALDVPTKTVETFLIVTSKMNTGVLRGSDRIHTWRIQREVTDNIMRDLYAIHI